MYRNYEAIYAREGQASRLAYGDRGGAGSGHTSTTISAIAAPMHHSQRRSAALMAGGSVGLNADSTSITATVKAASRA